MKNLVPELVVSDFKRSLAFYESLGFRAEYSRPEERFAYLTRDGADLMIEQTMEGSRRFVVGALEVPFGRGVNFQIKVADATALYAVAQRECMQLFLPLEERWYRRTEHEVGNRQFVLIDPDGYLLRFAQDLGPRMSDE